MGYYNKINSCYYSFNQSLIIKAETVFRNRVKCLKINETIDLQRAPISQVANILLTASKIIINTHAPLKAQIDSNYRLTEIDLDLERTEQYDDLLASLNYENKLIDQSGGCYEKQYKKNSLMLLLQGSIDVMQPTLLENLSQMSPYERDEMNETFSSIGKLF